MNEVEDQGINTLENVILSFILIFYLMGNIGVLIVIEQYNVSSQPKLIVKGEVLTMEYWNLTTEEVNVNFNIISGEKENLTVHYCTLTIFNKLALSRVNYTFEISIINHYHIQIGSIIEIYEYYPFLEIKVFNK